MTQESAAAPIVICVLLKTVYSNFAAADRGAGHNPENYPSDISAANYNICLAPTPRQRTDHIMIAILNLGRLLMVAWIIYALILLFAPQYLHRPPDNVGAAVQAVAAFVLGNLMDRGIGILRRRKAAREAGAPAGASDSGV
jgi:hypothetical protein